jgi:hypothetical protein
MFHLARGNVMLISLLILLAVLLGFAIVGMVLSVGEEQGGTAALNKAKARQASTACLETAMDKLGRDAAYAGNETVTVASTTCSILAVTSSTTWMIRAQATVGTEISRERVILSSRSPITIQSWTEVPSF